MSNSRRSNALPQLSLPSLNNSRAPSPAPSGPPQPSPERTPLARADSYSLRLPPPGGVSSQRLRARSVTAAGTPTTSVGDYSSRLPPPPQPHSHSQQRGWEYTTDYGAAQYQYPDADEDDSDSPALTHPSGPSSASSSTDDSSLPATPVGVFRGLWEGRPRSRTLDELVELRKGKTAGAKAMGTVEEAGLPIWSPTLGTNSASPPLVMEYPPAPSLSTNAPSNDVGTAPPTTMYPRHSIHVLLPRVGALATLLLIGLSIIAFLLSTVPNLHIPTSISAITAQIQTLQSYSSSSANHYFHLLFVLSTTFVFKQAFSIPGSALVNVLMGAVFGTFWATTFTCVLTAVGSTFAYYMATLCKPLVETFMVPGTKKYDQAELTSYLLVARLLPVVPYAALNVVSGVLELPLVPFFGTLVVGSLPYNWVTTEVGDIISISLSKGTGTIDTTSLWSSTMLFKLLLVSAVGTLPVIFKSRLRSLVSSLVGSSSPTPTSTTTEPIPEEAEELLGGVGGVRGREWVGTAGAGRRDEVDELRSSTNQSSSSSSWPTPAAWKRVSASLTTLDPFAVSKAVAFSGRPSTPTAHHAHTGSTSTTNSDRRVASLVRGKAVAHDEWGVQALVGGVSGTGSAGRREDDHVHGHAHHHQKHVSATTGKNKRGGHVRTATDSGVVV